jgi:hypothetical protein
MAGVKGNSGGKKGRSGRRPKAEEMGLVALLNKCFTPADREECIMKLAEDCLSSDFHERNESRKLLLAYTFGKPTEKHEHSGADGDAIEIVITHVKSSA